MRAPFQVLVLLYRQKNTEIDFLILKRSDDLYWQFISGGGEDSEKPKEAALRETNEEVGVKNISLFKLKSKTNISVEHVCGFAWGKDILLIPEFVFLAKIAFDTEIIISEEHIDFRWVKYNEALRILKWDSNKTALWESNYRILNNYWL